MQKIEIYPSILAADFSKLGEEIQQVQSAGADGIHFDVMDGHFVPNISFGAVVLQSIRKLTHLPFWVHLMIMDPVRYAEDFINAGADGLFIHSEIEYDIRQLTEKIRTLGVKPGLAINPETGISEIESLIPCFNDFLVMTVNPGFGGQRMIESALKKVSIIKKISLNCQIEATVHVDGGINEQTITDVVRAGADVLIAGSSIFRQPSPDQALIHLRQTAESHGSCDDE